MIERRFLVVVKFFLSYSYFDLMLWASTIPKLTSSLFSCPITDFLVTRKEILSSGSTP